MAAASKSVVRREEAPVVPADYRIDLSNRSVTGFVLAGVVVAFLIFLSGLVLGVRVKLNSAPPPAPKVSATAPATGQPS